MAEVQKQLAWTTPPPGKVSSEVVGNDILAMMTSMVTGRAGQVKPVDIKDGEYWTKIASDGTLTKYRWTLADGDTDGTPEQTILGSITAKAGHFPLPYTDPDTGKVVFDKSWQMGGGGMPIGASIAVYCTPTYTPFGAVPQDGATYSEAQFPNVVEYIEDGYIPWKTPTDYEAEITAHGKCACFAWDASTRTFRVPRMPDGTFVQQAMSDSELGKSYDAGLPNIEGNLGLYADGWRYGNGVFRLGSSVTSRANAGDANNPIDAYFDASLSNPIYGNSDTVQPSAIALRHFVVVATETDQQSVMDWSAWASALGGKANTDLSNVTFGSLDFSLFTPDYDNLVPLPAALYTVTKAGFVRIQSDTGGQWKINGEQVFFSANPDLTLVPVGVGDVVDSTGGANSNFAFIPFKGAV